MEIFIVVLLVVYTAFKDFLYYKEREKLQKKLMSKDLTDYIANEEPEVENTPQEEDPYIPIEEATMEQILRSKDIR